MSTYEVDHAVVLLGIKKQKQNDLIVEMLHLCWKGPSVLQTELLYPSPQNKARSLVFRNLWFQCPIDFVSKWKIKPPAFICKFVTTQTITCHTLKESWIRPCQVYEFSQQLNWDLHDKHYCSLEAHLIRCQGLMWVGCLWSHCGRILEKDPGSGSPALPKPSRFMSSPWCGRFGVAIIKMQRS